MNSFAALMVIIACQTDGSACVKEPVAVISFNDTAICRAALPQQVEKARRLASVVYGDCIPVDPALLAGRPEIHKAIDPKKLAAALSSDPSQQTATAFAPPGKFPDLTSPQW